MPRAGLTAGRVVEAAGNVADDCGIANLTLTAVASRLGVRAPSLYKHIDGLAALHRLVSIRAQAELVGVLTEAIAGKAGTQAIIALAGAYRAWAVEHPGRYAAAVGPVGSGQSEDAGPGHAIDGVALAALTGYRLEGDDAADAACALCAALHGFASLGSGLPAETGRSFDRLITALTQAFSAWPPAAAHTTP